MPSDADRGGAARHGGRPPSPAAAARRFAAGVLTPFLAWLVLLPALGALGLYVGGGVWRPLAVLAAACAAGGWVAGGAFGAGHFDSGPSGSRRARAGVRGGWRARVAFAAAFCVASWPPLLLLNTLPALGGREGVLGLAAVFGPGFALSFAALAAIGFGLAGAGWRAALRAAAAFGAAGAGGGALVAAAASLAPGAGGAAGFAVQALGGGAAFVLPAAVGGWWVSRRRAL